MGLRGVVVVVPFFTSGGDCGGVSCRGSLSVIEEMWLSMGYGNVDGIMFVAMQPCLLK